MTAVYRSPPTSLPPSSVEDIVPSPPSDSQPTISGVVPFTVSSIQSVLADVVASLMCGFLPASADVASVVSQALDPTALCEIQLLEPLNG